MQNLREEPTLVLDTGRDENFFLRQAGSQFGRVQPVPEAQRRLQVGVLRVEEEELRSSKVLKFESSKGGE